MSDIGNATNDPITKARIHLDKNPPLSPVFTQVKKNDTKNPMAIAMIEAKINGANFLFI